MAYKLTLKEGDKVIFKVKDRNILYNKLCEAPEWIEGKLEDLSKRLLGINCGDGYYIAVCPIGNYISKISGMNIAAIVIKKVS